MFYNVIGYYGEVFTMDVKMDNLEIFEENDGLTINCEEPLYIFANIKGYDFKFNRQFTSHFLNNTQNKRFIVEREDILVVSSVEFFDKRYFTNVSLIINTDLDNIALINIYKTVVETISTTLYENNLSNLDLLTNKLGNYYNVIFVASTGKSEIDVPFDLSLYYEVKEVVEEALNKSLMELVK